jgi:hypothetical protein
MRLSIQLEIQRPRQLPRPRRLLVALTVALGLLIPAATLAGHQFSDVPNDHLFHGDIARGYGARITAGCTATRFCPDGTVTRGQMMAFMNRGLGRVEYGLLGGSVASATRVSVGSVSITAGNVTGGQAYVYLIGTASAYVGGAGCPCEATVGIFRGAGQVTTETYIDLPATAPPDDDTDEIGTTLGVVSVPTGVPQTFTVMMRRTAGIASIAVYGNVIAMVVPFNGIGVPPGEELPGPLGPLPAKAGEG